MGPVEIPGLGLQRQGTSTAAWSAANAPYAEREVAARLKSLLNSAGMGPGIHERPAGSGVGQRPVKAVKKRENTEAATAT